MKHMIFFNVYFAVFFTQGFKFTNEGGSLMGNFSYVYGLFFGLVLKS